jgi:hypothetical protein
MSEGAEQVGLEADDSAREQRRKHRSKHKRKSRKQERLLRNLAWLGGGLAVGLPLLAAMLYLMSHY